MINEKYIQTPFGIYNGISTAEYYEDGTIKGLRLNEKNMIVTHVGELVPFYSEDSQRRKYKSSVTFHKSGMIKSISLDEQQEIITPIGEFPAELVTFYETGELKRFFPLDGKISGFWSEDDERNLNIPFSFEFEFTNFSAMLVGVCFYKNGQIRSITLFPNEIIEIDTKLYGKISVKNGFSIYESGVLESIEPAVPVTISTVIGTITAYDVNSLGINADSNSLIFYEDGKVKSIITSSDKIAIAQNNGVMKFFTPLEKLSPLDENEKTIIPLKIYFDYTNNLISITDETTYSFTISDCTFNIFKGDIAGCSPADCASCTLCSH